MELQGDPNFKKG